MSPVIKANSGIAAPIAAEHIAHKIIRTISFLLAKRNSDRKGTAF